MTTYQKWQIFFGIVFLVSTTIVVVQVMSAGPASPVSEEVIEAEEAIAEEEEDTGSTIQTDQESVAENNTEYDRSDSGTQTSLFREFLSPAGLTSIGSLFLLFLNWRKDKRESEGHQLEMKKKR